MITVTMHLQESQAEALALFLKRLYHEDFADKAKNLVELLDMKDAAYQAQRALADAGFDPR